MADALVTTMKSLKLHGMAQAVADLAAQQGPAFKQAERVLSDLIKAEVAEREARSIQYQLKSARFPAYRDLAGFKFEESAVDVALVKSLHGCDFIEQAHNVVLIGGPGTGKTHLATAIGVQAIMHHHLRVRFFSTIEQGCCFAPKTDPGFASKIDPPASRCPMQRFACSTAVEMLRRDATLHGCAGARLVRSHWSGAVVGPSAVPGCAQALAAVKAKPKSHDDLHVVTPQTSLKANLCSADRSDSESPIGVGGATRDHRQAPLL